MNVDSLINLTRRLTEAGHTFTMRVEPLGPIESPGSNIRVTLNVFCKPDAVTRLLELADGYELASALIEDGISLTG